jgi:hypothetical protein
LISTTSIRLFLCQLTDNTLCGAGGNGAINLTVSPPNSSYTYLWSNNATTQDLNNLPPGSYEVTVSAGGACTETAIYVINDNPNDPDLTFIQVDANCGLNNGSINLSVTGGTTPTHITGRMAPQYRI